MVKSFQYKDANEALMAEDEIAIKGRSTTLLLCGRTIFMPQTCC